MIRVIWAACSIGEIQEDERESHSVLVRSCTNAPFAMKREIEVICITVFTFPAFSAAKVFP